jgi:transposase-like protein
VHPGVSGSLSSLLPIAHDPTYRKRAFDADNVELYVRWYITNRVSSRDLVEMMAERGIQVAHTTVVRSVTRYVPEFEKRWNRFAKAVGTSWRVDETYISIKARWHYLYRAVDNFENRVTSPAWADCPSIMRISLSFRHPS